MRFALLLALAIPFSTLAGCRRYPPEVPGKNACIRATHYQRGKHDRDRYAIREREVSEAEMDRELARAGYRADVERTNAAALSGILTAGSSIVTIPSGFPIVVACPPLAITVFGIGVGAMIAGIATAEHATNAHADLIRAYDARAEKEGCPLP